MTTPHFRTRLSLALAGPLALVASAQAGHQIDPPANPPDAPWMEPLVGTGLKTSDVYTDGNVFLTVPLWSTLGNDGRLGGNYLFLEPYTSLGEQGEVATSLGLGFRHLFSDESRSALEKKGVAGFLDEGWFVGGSVFGDMLNTQHHNQFWQMGVGGEMGTRYFEVRGNYYIPLTDEKLYASSTSQQTASSASTHTEGGDLFAAGHSIVESASSTIQTTTTSTTTSTTQLFEKGMRGWDAEAVLLVPWVDQWMDLRANGGYFHFNNQPFGPSDGPTGPVRGWKAGAELRPVPAIVLGAEWYEDERFTGSNWIVSVEFQIPLDRHWTDAFQMRRRHLIEHLAEPVHRQNDAIKVGNREDQKATVSTSTTSKVVGQTAGGNVVATDFIFVNNGAAQRNGIQTGSGGGDGTAEHPADTITLGATLAGTQSNTTGNLWTAYVQGGGANYTGLATVTGSTRFLSSSQPLVFHGKTFGGKGPNAVLDGAFLADGVAQPTIQTVSVQGFTILHGSGGTSPIDFSNVPNATITNNFIQQATGSGIHLAASTGTSNIILTGNFISGAGADGVNANFSGGTSSLTATGNTVTLPVGNGFNLVSTNPTAGASTATVSSNTVVDAGQNGILLAAEQGGAFTVTATGNNVVNSTADGIAFQAGVGGVTSTMTATATGNQVVSSTGNGISATTNAASTLTLGASGNAITTPGGNGFSLASNGTSTLTTTLTGNIITGSTGNGIELTSNGASTLTATSVSGNIISGTTTNAILLSGSGGSLQFAVNDNIILANGGNGISVQNAGGSTSTINGNSISGMTTNAILVSAGSDFGSVNDNIIMANGGNGISVQNAGGSTSTINGNSISGTTTDAILVSASSVADVAQFASVNDNIIMANGGSGITIQETSTVGTAGTIASTIDGNTISGTTTDAILLFSSGVAGVVQFASVNDNIIMANGGTGIRVLCTGVSGTVGNSTSTIDGNTISGTTTDAILVATTGIAGTMNIASVNNNIVKATGGNGLDFQAPALLGTFSKFTVTGNTVNYAGGNGMVFASSFGEINVSAFDGNTITLTGPATGDHIHLTGVGMTINGTLNNTVTPVPNTLGGDTVNNAAGATGTIIINGTSVDLSATSVVP